MDGRRDRIAHPCPAWSTPSPLAAAIKEFLRLQPAQTRSWDQTNPLAELTHKAADPRPGQAASPVSGPGLLFRDIPPVPPLTAGSVPLKRRKQSEMPGLIGSLATHARVNEYGFIENTVIWRCSTASSNKQNDPNSTSPLTWKI